MVLLFLEEQNVLMLPELASWFGGNSKPRPGLFDAVYFRALLIVVTEDLGNEKAPGSP